jgi:hypothetical protein
MERERENNGLLPKYATITTKNCCYNILRNPKKYGKKPRLVNSSVTQDPFPGMESFMGKGKNEGKKIETIDVQSRMHPLVW